MFAIVLNRLVQNRLILEQISTGQSIEVQYTLLHYIKEPLRFAS